jgi:hypothetical protein
MALDGITRYRETWEREKKGKGRQCNKTKAPQGRHPERPKTTETVK